MFPSKAERILSRYRPIAPKPLPLPPSGSFGTTDPSSTCASVDSFTSSAKCKKSRKRKFEDPASVKGLKAPKPVGSGLSNTGGASSLTQGASDGTVPPGDLRSASQISHGSMGFGAEDFGEMSNGATRDARLVSADTRFAAYNSVAAPLYVSDAGNMLQQQGIYMSTDVNAQQQHAFSLFHQKVSSGYNRSGDGPTEKDIGFMERAAAASATVLPDRPATVSMCDPVGGKGIGYVGGGFTEMIRGITRLPTAADVQSLMQARASSSVVSGQAAPGSSSNCMRTSPTRSREMQSQRVDLYPLPPISHLIGKPLSLSEADQVCGSDAGLTTLSLLPNVPSKMCSPSRVVVRDGSPSVQSSLQSITHSAEVTWQQQQTSSRLEPLAKLAIRDVPSLAHPPAYGVMHISEPPLHQQGFSRFDASVKPVIQQGSSSAQIPVPGVTHGVEPFWHQEASSRLESSEQLACRSPCMSQSGVQLASEVPLYALPPKKLASGLIIPSMSLPGMGMAANPVMVNGAVIDEVSLEQVYGGSTEDPILLIDDNNRILWFNKPYDRALKSAIERTSGKTKTTGPYIDPLGHPTPLGSFVLPIHGKSSRATLWGFLKKFVIQESELPLQQQGLPGPSNQLQLCVGEASLRMSPPCVDPSSRTGSVVCASNSRLTTVTLESVTELHMDDPAALECVEAVEARLGAGSEPAFITDSSNRVRWVNAGLKKMLGHINPEGSNSCSGLSGSSGADGAMSIPVEASTFVVCCTEKIPRSASAFSCRVNLEWMKGNKRRSMTVPCDVIRLSCTSRSPEVNWVWQFDMAVSLRLS